MLNDTIDNDNNTVETGSTNVPIALEPVVEQPSTTKLVDDDYNHHDDDDHNDKYNVDDNYNNEVMGKSKLFTTNDKM
jgi:hypothetical protein